MRVGWRKKLGLAGLATVAATGVLIVRAERRRRAYTPEEVREQLRSRVAHGSETATGTASPDGTERTSPPQRLQAWIRARARSRRWG